MAAAFARCCQVGIVGVDALLGLLMLRDPKGQLESGGVPLGDAAFYSAVSREGFLHMFRLNAIAHLARAAFLAQEGPTPWGFLLVFVQGCAVAFQEHQILARYKALPGVLQSHLEAVQGGRALYGVLALVAGAGLVSALCTQRPKRK